MFVDELSEKIQDFISKNANAGKPVNFNIIDSEATEALKRLHGKFVNVRELCNRLVATEADDQAAEEHREPEHGAALPDRDAGLVRERGAAEAGRKHSFALRL